MPAVRVQNLVFSYDAADNIAVNNVSFELKHGSYTVLAGMNGSGKSTTARIIAGLLQAQKGSVEIEEGLRVGIIFQSPKDQIICSIVSDDTSFGPKNMGFSKAEVELNTIESLSATGMIPFANHKSMNLSLGQTQKVALSGILAMDPDILILDEALSMLDPKSREEMYHFIDLVNSKGCTILHISHDIESVTRARNVILMNKGKVCWEGTCQDFLSDEKLVEKLTGKELEIKKEKWTSEGKEISLSARDLSFSYDKKNPVLNKLSFDLYRGTLTALVGPSGSGKSTLLEILSGLLVQESGEIVCSERPSLAQQNTDAALFENYAADDVAFGPRNKGLAGKKLLQVVKDAMKKCNIDYEVFGNRQTFCLSGGEKKRLAVAGIVALDSEIILFDEPATALDGESRYKIMHLMRELADSGKTVLFSTHKRDEAAFADKVINLASDNLLAEASSQGSLEKLKRPDSLKILENLRKLAFLNTEKKSGITGKLPDVLKVLLFLFTFVFSLCVNNLRVQVLFLLFGFFYALLSAFSVKRLLLSMIKIIPLLLFFCIFQMIFAPSLADEIRYLDYKFFTVTPSKLVNCLKILLRTECALTLICGFVNSINENQLINAFSILLYPLKLFRFPVKYCLILIEIVFRFIPLLLEEATCIIKTQLVRGGLGKARGFFGKIRAVIPLLVPLIIQSLKRAEILAEALTARGFK